MRLIHITNYDQDTMKLARPIYDGKGRMLMGANQTIHPVYLKRLKETGIRTLAVEDEVSKGITLDEMLDMPTWMDIMQYVQEAYELSAKNKPLPIEHLQKGAGKLLAEIKRRPLIMTIPTSSIAQEMQAYAHAVNVALLAAQVGKQLVYNELQLRDLILGSLLHDIGKAVTSEEADHPKQGFEILRQCRELNLLSAHIAYQHHETVNGKGYPRGLADKDIIEFAQVCGICNRFDNAVSQEQMPPHEAMEMIMSQNETAFSDTVVQAFVRVTPTYPPGTKVKLHEGEEAIVTQIQSHMQRPFVRIINTNEEVDLSQQLTAVITAAVS